MFEERSHTLQNETQHLRQRVASRKAQPARREGILQESHEPMLLQTTLDHRPGPIARHWPLHPAAPAQHQQEAARQALSKVRARVGTCVLVAEMPERREQ
jgi:hypothetical protein